MTRSIPAAALVALTCGLSFAQQPSFEVASVKPTGPDRRYVSMSGGPGTSDPGRITAENMSLRALVSHAYSVDYYQVSGPDWTEAEHYDIVAKVPEGATKEQSLVMLQTLLAERFKLVLRRESKERQVYSLAIAKGGPKLKSPEPDPATTEPKANPDASPRIKKDKDGYPILGAGMTMAISGNRASMFGHKRPMSWLVQQLTGQTGAPVTDATGLKGEYDFSLAWVPTRPGTGPDVSGNLDGPDLFAALPEQLGLRLESKKAPVEYLVIERAEKTPVENSPAIPPATPAPPLHATPYPD